MNDVPLNDAMQHADTAIPDARTSSGHLIDDAIQGLGEVAHATAEALRAAGHSASSLVSRLGEAVPEARDQVATGVQARPLTAIMISAGVGLLAGAALVRR
jgi:ElaB/YqjD/DUF883 family membrane-anchored ribosome-binding protein